MSEDGTLGKFRLVDDPVARHNFEQIERMGLGRGPAQARVFHSAAQTIATATSVGLAFNSERWDTGNFHSTVTNNSRLTAPTAGLYSIGASIEWAANATGVRVLSVRLNTTTVIDQVTYGPSPAPDVTRQSLSTQYQLAAGDFVDVVVFQRSGGNLNIAAAGNYSPEFWIARLGSQA